MKKAIITLLLLMTTCLLYATEDYRGGNGIILRKETIGDKEIEVRKFEVSNYYAGLWSIDDKTPYDDYINKKKIGFMNCEGDNPLLIDIFEICFISDVKKDNQGEAWIKLSDKKITGWLLIGHNNYYENGNYLYIGNINGYNIRKLNQGVSACVNPLIIREMSGYTTKIIAEV